MKIAITSDIYVPMTNGVAVFAQNLAEGLAQRGHEVLMIHPSPDGKAWRRTNRRTGVKTVALKSVKLVVYPDQVAEVPAQKEIFGKKLPRVFYKNGLRFCPYPYPELKKALDKFQPDVVHLQTAEMVAAATLKYVRKNNIPLVSTGHAYPDNITGQLRLMRWIKPLKKSTDAILRAYMASYLKNSEYATMPTEMAINDLVPKDRKKFTVTVEPLSNGVDLSHFKPGKPAAKVLKKYSLESDVSRALYVGRVDPEKSISIVVEAFAKVLRELPEAELTVVGDGIDLAHLQELAQELGIDERVKFTGKIKPPELMEIYRSGRLFVTASETETQGIVLIEAAASGLPLVAVDGGAVKEVCQDGRNGVLCAPRDVDALAGGMVRILSDAKLQQRYSAESLKIAKTHDLGHTLQRFEEIYAEAIKIKAEKSRDNS